jgi:transketolase
MRKAFAETLFKLAEADPRIIFLTGDMGFGTFDAFKEKFGKRYVNVGVAEQQLIATAAGLALEGWKPVCYSIASFLTARPFEFTRFLIGHHNLPVILVGAGGGLYYESSGFSHHATDDFALMKLIPNMLPMDVNNAEDVRWKLPEAFNLKQPVYMRLGSKK